MAQIQTHITRGNLIESTHKSKCVIKNYNYKTVFSTKNNKDLVYPRSAIKILQAIPFIGQILSIAMILLDVFKWLARKLVPAFSEESQAAKESWKDMN